MNSGILNIIVIGYNFCNSHPFCYHGYTRKGKISNFMVIINFDYLQLWLMFQSNGY